MDEFDKLFLSREEAQRLHKERMRERLAKYLLAMPEELRALFSEEFERKAKPAPAGGEARE